MAVSDHTVRIEEGNHFINDEENGCIQNSETIEDHKDIDEEDEDN